MLKLNTKEVQCNLRLETTLNDVTCGRNPDQWFCKPKDYDKSTASQRIDTILKP